MKFWKDELKKNICTIGELKEIIPLDKKEEDVLKKISQRHPINITRYYLSLIDVEDKNDPLRKILVPSIFELSRKGSYDTSGEKKNVKVTGLQHKYDQTALILTTNYCASYCRFCFRRRLIGISNKEVLSELDPVIKYISEHKEINNVLLSGGDTLTLENNIIKEYLERLTEIDHLEYIRIGSRVPIVFPSRIISDNSLLEILKEFTLKKRIHIVTHFLHPKEITPKSTEAFNKLLNCGLIVHNQTVLLKEINDNPNILADLLNKRASSYK